MAFELLYDTKRQYLLERDVFYLCKINKNFYDSNK